MMWQIKLGKNTAYVLGSIHAAIKGFYPLPKEIEDAYENSDKLLVEVDITKPFSLKELPDFEAGAFYDCPDSLWKRLDEKTAERLRKILDAQNYPSKRFSILKPWLAAHEITIIASRTGGAETKFGIDLYFLSKAKGKKQIVGLESYEFQQQLFYRQPEDEQVRYLIAALDRLEKYPNYMAEIMTLWLIGDEMPLAHFLSEVDSEPAVMMRQIYEGRNPKMAEAVEKCLKTGERCFMVVGAAHVVGKEGVVSILKNKGYQTQQVKVKIN